MKTFLGTLTLSCVAFAAPAAAQTAFAEPGFAVTDASNVRFGEAYASFADGRYIGLDGIEIALYASDGTQLQLYDTFGTFVFPSFVALDPTETFAILGESSNGDLFRLDLATGTVAPLVNLNLNFSFAFDADPDFGFVSAALGGFGNGNDVVRVHLTTGATTPVLHVAGPSGPVAIAPTGDLYYITQSDDFPPPPAASSILVWTDAQLDAGVMLSELDAVTFASGLDGGSSILPEAVSDHVFALETTFGSGSRLLQYTADGALFAVDAVTVDYASNIELFHGAGTATFAAFQPSGARLLLASTEFGAGTSERITLEPARPVATFSGPQNGNSGPASVTITDAFPGGEISVVLALSQDMQDPEVVLNLGWGAPVHLALQPNDLIRRTTRITVDAQGTAQINYVQPPLLTGEWMFQAIAYDDANNPLGTSTAVIND
ncbi:MAG: hypothetical protein GY711_32430 [bacterium]|nr:hypothetical protein [bacterium]